MQFKFINSIFETTEMEWDALWPTHYPFSSFAFLSALERSGSTTAKNGWQPQHLLGFENGTLTFAMPLFIKHHSYGEYVFDWGWADAYDRAGLDYYPKLLNAIPFTPATGPRWACSTTFEIKHILGIEEQLKNKASELHASSFHSLFPSHASAAAFKSNLFIQRRACQYHWFNRNYKDFDAFLADLSSRKRKNIRKERAKCAHYNIQLRHGNETEEADWTLFYALYHRTYFKRSGRPGYLTESFFSELAQTLGEQIILALVEYEGKKIAGAVYFKDESCLYGRYWGTLEDIDGLHFETCYYKGIEYAIEHGLTRFDPGAQGEHKILRGFQPIQTCSYHWIADPRFEMAIRDFCEAESNDNDDYIQKAREVLPFKEGHPVVDIDTLIKAPTMNN